MEATDTYLAPIMGADATGNFDGMEECAEPRRHHVAPRFMGQGAGGSPLAIAEIVH